MAAKIFQPQDQHFLIFPEMKDIFHISADNSVWKKGIWNEISLYKNLKHVDMQEIVI